MRLEYPRNDTDDEKTVALKMCMESLDLQRRLIEDGYVKQTLALPVGICTYLPSIKAAIDAGHKAIGDTSCPTR